MLIDERKFHILQAIIDDYILTGIPVGSRTISKKCGMGLSSATIRNEMSDLEELGYLAQPHVSAGRIPSTKAYRLYVDQLLKNNVIQSDDAQSVKDHLNFRARQMEEAMAKTAQVLSGLTHYTSVVMGPKNSGIRVQNLQLIPVTEGSALLVLVTDKGEVQNTVIHMNPLPDEDALYALSRHLTHMLRGSTLEEAVQKLREAPEMAGQAEKETVAFLQSLESKTGKTRITLGNPSNILNYPEYNDIEKAKGFLSILETKDQLIHLLEQHGDMEFSVRIGPETGIPELSDCSLVTATYRLNDSSHGTIGIIGPTRMQYGRVLSILSAVGRQLSNMLEQKE